MKPMVTKVSRTAPASAATSSGNRQQDYNSGRSIVRVAGKQPKQRRAKAVAVVGSAPVPGLQTEPLVRGNAFGGGRGGNGANGVRSATLGGVGRQSIRRVRGAAVENGGDSAEDQNAQSGGTDKSGERHDVAQQSSPEEQNNIIEASTSEDNDWVKSTAIANRVASAANFIKVVSGNAKRDMKPVLDDLNTVAKGEFLGPEKQAEGKLLKSLLGTKSRTKRMNALGEYLLTKSIPPILRSPSVGLMGKLHFKDPNFLQSLQEKYEKILNGESLGPSQEDKLTEQFLNDVRNNPAPSNGDAPRAIKYLSDLVKLKGSAAPGHPVF